MSIRPRDTDLISVPVSTLHAMRDVLVRQKGAVEAAGLLRDIGLAAGDAFYELLRSSADPGAGVGRPLEDLTIDEFWSRLSGLFSDLGWGRLEHSQIADGVFSLTAYDWAEGDADRGATSYFTAGVLAAILHRVAGASLAVLEVGEVQGDGASRFILGSPETLQAVFLHMQDGAGYEHAIATVGASPSPE